MRVVTGSKLRGPRSSRRGSLAGWTLVTLAAAVLAGGLPAVDATAQAGCPTATPIGQLPSGLVAWWPAEGSACDAAGTNDGTPQNGVTYGTGVFGQAFELDGIDDHVQIRQSTFNGLTDFTVDAWVRLVQGTTTGTSGATVVSGMKNGFKHFFTLHVVPASGALSLDVLINAPLRLSALYPDDDLFHHIAVTHAGSTLSLYVDAQLRDQVFFSGAVQSNNGTTAIGAQDPLTGPSRPLEGQIDELHIFDRALSVPELLVLAAPPPPDNLPPIANAGPDQIVECAGPEGTTVTLNGSASSTDPPGGSLTFAWNGPFGQVGGSTADAIVEVDLPVGGHTIGLTVMDESAEMDTDELLVAVQDTTAPTVIAQLVPLARGKGDGKSDGKSGKSDDDSGKSDDRSGKSDDKSDGKSGRSDDRSGGKAGNRFRVVAQATDVCDDNPTATAEINGYPVADGQEVIIKLKGRKTKVRTKKGVLEISTPEAVLTVTASDGANGATEKVVLRKH